MFVFYFDVAAIIITIVIMIMNLTRKEMKSAVYYLFWILNLFILITPFSDILSIYYMHRYNSKIAFELVNTLFYLSQLIITVIFLQYVLSRVMIHTRIPTIKKLLLTIPAALYVIGLLLNPFINIIWSFDDVTLSYMHGSFFELVIAIPVFYFLVSIFGLIRFRDKYTSAVRVAIILAMIINMGAVILELIFPTIMFHSFGFAVTDIIIFICIKNQNSAVNPKTGMPNISYYIDYVDKLLFSEQEFVLNFVRIADYELFTSTYGFETTVELMNSIARKLTDEFKLGEVYAIDQNFFAVITTDVEENAKVQKRIKNVFDQEWKIGEVETAFSYFIVGLHYPVDVKSFDDIISYGQYIQRMHRKRYGIVDISELELRDTVREKTVEKYIEAGLKNDCFEIYMQPIFSNKKGIFNTAEALLRLNIPGVGFISPAEFIPISEKNGTIIKIGNVVMDKVFKFISETDINKLGIDYIELNLSTIQCLQRNFMDNLYECLKDYHVDPHQVCFEITETASNCAPDVFDMNLAHLRKGGYKIAIDDYGSGYSNISRLIESSFDIIKFDNKTVEQICSSSSFKKVFDKMVQIIHATNADIVAEGVESKDQFDYLKTVGVDYIQGYYFSKPMPIDEYIAFLEKNNNVHA